MRRPSAPILWAFSATLSAASSTVIYLLFAHGQPWAANFIQLYSTMGMVAGWMNALIYFISPRSFFLQSRQGAILCMAIAILLTKLFFQLAFAHAFGWNEFFFVFSGLIPVLYANAFGVEFYEGNYPWVYRRTVLYNISLLFVALLAWFFTPSQEGLFHWTGIVGLVWLIVWNYDRWNTIDVPKVRPQSLRPWLNPSLPILERTLWDQWVLARLGALDWSFWIYLIGRVITFSGNVAYSYLWSTNSKAHRSRRNVPAISWAIILIAVPVALGGLRYVWCAFLLGQLFSWLITTELTSEYSSENTRYGKFLMIWALDLAWRGLALALSNSPDEYGRFVVTSGLLGIVGMTVFLTKRRVLPLPEKTNTKFQTADFPGKR